MVENHGHFGEPNAANLGAQLLEPISDSSVEMSALWEAGDFALLFSNAEREANLQRAQAQLLSATVY